MTRPTQTAIRITLIYVVLSVFWIAFSDALVNSLLPPQSAARVQTLKGIFFILVTGVVLFGLIRRSLRRELRSHTAYSESEYRWRELVEQITNAIVILDGTRIVFANSGAAQLIGSDAAGELIGRKIEDFLFVDDIEVAVRSIEAVTQGKKLPPGQFRVRRCNGEEATIEAHSTSITFFDYPVVLCVMVDVTQLVEQRKMLMKAKKEAERLAQAKSTLLTNMSHEIRTPLTGILGISELIAEEASGEASELAALLQDSGWRLMRTLDSILTLAQLDSKAVDIQSRPIDVTRTVRALARTFKPEAEQKGLELHLEVPHGRIEALADAAALDQILLNLLSNALKFTTKGRVCVRLGRDEGRVRIEVEDTGIGIAATFLPHLFEEYQQESEGLRRNYEGSGLGLAIAKRLVDMMDGQIEVESRKGVGTLFRVTLPAAHIDGGTRPAPRRLTDRHLSRKGKG